MCQVWLKMAHWFWRRFLKALNVFLLFPNYLPFKKGVVLHLNKLESPSPNNVLCQFCLKLDQWFGRRRFFCFQLIVTISQLFRPLRRTWLFIDKLESPPPNDALCQVWLKLAQWFWRKRFLKVVNLFLLFPNYLPLEKDLALHLNILESPSPGDTLCQVWLKLAKWSWRRR